MPNASAAMAGVSRRFLIRLGSSVVMFAGLLLAWHFKVLPLVVWGILFAALLEWQTFSNRSWLHRGALIANFALIIVVYYAYNAFLLLAIVLLALIPFAAKSHWRTLFPFPILLYLTIPGMAFAEIYQTQPLYTIFVFAVVMVTDVGAYAVGKSMGKNPLAPVLSPKKTVEGAIGGLIIAMIFGVMVATWTVYNLAPLQAIILAALISIAGQAGDLLESAIKRHYGVKDSGRLLPGHGGVLDRIDGYLLAMPAVWLLWQLGAMASG